LFYFAERNQLATKDLITKRNPKQSNAVPNTLPLIQTIDKRVGVSIKIFQESKHYDPIAK
jgi:hypothetical protein